MIKIVVFILAIFLSVDASAVTISQLFQALKKQPITKIDTLITKSAEISKQKVNANFYPKIYGLASYEHFSSPTNLRPTAPTESSSIMAQHGALPFSRNIRKIGVKFSMPVFVYSLFSLSKKAQMMHKSAKEKARIKLLQNEAMIVSINANLRYLENLTLALEAKKKSLQAALKSIEIGVKNGRIPEIQAIKIDENINQIDIQRQAVESNIANLKSLMENLTSIKLEKSVDMQQTSNLNESEIYALKPIKSFTKAQKYALESEKRKRYPSITLKSQIFRNFGKGYNNNESVIRNYGSVGIYLSMPIFDKTINTDIQKAEVEYKKSKSTLEQTKLELLSESYALNKELDIVNKSIKIALKSVQNQKQLLRYAKVAFKNQRMTEEEYLRYEDALFRAKANLFNLHYKKWNIFSKLAVIYGNNLEEMVK